MSEMVRGFDGRIAALAFSYAKYLAASKAKPAPSAKPGLVYSGASSSDAAIEEARLKTSRAMCAAGGGNAAGSDAGRRLRRNSNFELPYSAAFVFESPQSVTTPTCMRVRGEG